MDHRQYFQEGFLPSPDESKEAFERRVELVKKVFQRPDAIEGFPLPKADCRPLLPSLLLFTSNKKLPFWYGAVTWILEPGEGIRLPVIQIRKKRWSFGLKEDEILAHEKVHALRVMYNEKKFEEILAFQTSRSRVRRFLSPMIGSYYEATALMLAFSLSLLSSISLFFFVLPFCTLSFFLGRLFYRRRIFQRAKKNAEKLVQEVEGFIVSLTDREILQLAKGKKLGDTSFRWEFLKSVFNLA